MKKNDILNIIKEAIDKKEKKNLSNKIITFEVRSDYDGDIENLINTIKDNSASGHSFEVVVDPNNPDYEKRFHIDGDGGTTIMNVKIESIENEKEDIDESVFLIDPDDDNLQSKIKTIKSNSTIFNPTSDTIKIKDDGDDLNMSEAKSSKISTGKTVLTKKDINNMILERKYNGKLFTKEELLKKLKKD